MLSPGGCIKALKEYECGVISNDIYVYNIAQTLSKWSEGERENICRHSGVFITCKDTPHTF
jgi:hypothetical protein